MDGVPHGPTARAQASASSSCSSRSSSLGLRSRRWCRCSSRRSCGIRATTHETWRFRWPRTRSRRSASWTTIRSRPRISAVPATRAGSLARTGTSSGMAPPSGTRSSTQSHPCRPRRLRAPSNTRRSRSKSRGSLLPRPVKAAVLQTLVYRQYAGPEIMSYTVGPPNIFDPDLPDAATIITSPVVVDVRISPEDIASMDATAGTLRIGAG